MIKEMLFERGLCLPSGTAMTEEDLDRIVEGIWKRCRAQGVRRREEIA